MAQLASDDDDAPLRPLKKQKQSAPLSPKISKKDFEELLKDIAILQDLKKRKFSSAHEVATKTLENVTCGGVNGIFQFEQILEQAPKFIFRFYPTGGDYQQCCKDPRRYLFRFSFETYEDFLQCFNQNAILVKHNLCDYHTFHRKAEVCQAKFLSGENEKCGICLKDFEKEKLEKTHCNHLFCLSCLNKWAKIENQKRESGKVENTFSCPKCRQNLGSDLADFCFECNNIVCRC